MLQVWLHFYCAQISPDLSLVSKVLERFMRTKVSLSTIYSQFRSCFSTQEALLYTGTTCCLQLIAVLFFFLHEKGLWISATYNSYHSDHTITIQPGNPWPLPLLGHGLLTVFTRVRVVLDSSFWKLCPVYNIWSSSRFNIWTLVFTYVLYLLLFTTLSWFSMQMTPCYICQLTAYRVSIFSNKTIIKSWHGQVDHSLNCML